MTSFMTLAEMLPEFPDKSETDQQKLVTAIKRWLEHCPERWLLIFDNADDLSWVHESHAMRNEMLRKLSTLTLMSQFLPLEKLMIVR